MARKRRHKVTDNFRFSSAFAAKPAICPMSHQLTGVKCPTDVSFAFALIRTGRLSEAQPLLFEAMTGNDPGLAQTASDYLSKIGKTSSKL